MNQRRTTTSWLIPIIIFPIILGVAGLLAFMMYEGVTSDGEFSSLLPDAWFNSMLGVYIFAPLLLLAPIPLILTFQALRRRFR